MTYDLEFRPEALKDLRAFPRKVADRILRKVDNLRSGFRGDVRRLVDPMPGYRLRVGDYRVLFVVAGHRIVVYRVKHRREAYDR
jgi:mRNA interferase RelE/StbE